MPSLAPAARTRRGRRGIPGTVLVGVALLTVLAGCATADDDAAVRTPAATTRPGPAQQTGADGTTDPGGTAGAPGVPDVPVAAATLPTAQAPVPPTAVTIDALGIALPVGPVGVQADGQMEIPPAAEVAGWYRFGAAPGDEQGTVVIAAHVDSVASAGLGPFARLGDLAVGDAVTVTTADGAVVTYAVTGRSSVAKPQVAWDEVFTRDGGHRLVLVTCGGVWHEDRRSYSDNVIVTAEPVDR